MTTGSGQNTPGVYIGPKTGASASPLVARDVEIGAQRAPDVARVHAVLDGLRGSAPAAPGQYVIDQ